MYNSLMVIAPYWFEGTWVFDDPEVDLVREAFVSGMPEMIDMLLADIPDAKRGFRLLFSSAPFPGYQQSIAWLREEYDGNWYKLDGSDREGWLCPALFKYFDKAPRTIYVKAEPRRDAT